MPLLGKNRLGPLVVKASTAELAWYPFGEGRGFQYLSKEAYTATGVLFSFIFTQSVFFGGFLFLSKYRTFALFVLLSPLIIYAFLILPTMH